MKDNAALNFLMGSAQLRDRFSETRAWYRAGASEEDPNKQTDASASADYMWNGGPKVLRLVDVSPIKILEGFYIRSNGS
jgi:hypothetical protein